MIVINKSKRTFIIAKDEELKPGEKGNFAESVGKRLIQLYPGELESMESAAKDFEDDSNAKPFEPEANKEPKVEKKLAKEVIAEIEEMNDLEALKEILETDDRSTVKDAVEKRIAELEEALTDPNAVTPPPPPAAYDPNAAK